MAQIDDVRMLYDKEEAAWHAYGGPFPLGTAAQDAEYERYLQMLMRGRRAKLDVGPTKVWCRKEYREEAMRLIQGNKAQQKQ